MLIERIVGPQSKLACARGISQATQTSTLGSLLRLPEAFDEDRLYAARDWLWERQGAGRQRWRSGICTRRAWCSMT